MKRFLFLSLVLFLITSASALTITTPETIDQGSTAIFTLQGNILDPITKSDVGFYEGHVQKPFNYDIEKIEDIYYIYALIPYNTKNYSLRISDVYFKENNEFKTLDLEANFSTSQQVAEFNVDPGFVITSKDSFDLQIYNNLNSNLQITYTIGQTQKQKTLPLQETTKITIDLKNLKSTALNTLTIASANSEYQMPVYTIRDKFGEPEPTIEPAITENGTIVEPTPTIILKSDLRFSADTVDETLKVGEIREIILGLKNFGNEPSGRINFEVSDEIKNITELETASISGIDPGEEAEIKFSISSETAGKFEGGILADSSDSFDELKLILLIDNNAKPVTSIRSESTCAELKGEVCLSSQTCSGTTVPSSGNTPCCTAGSCLVPGETQEEDSNFNTVSIILVALAILIIIGAIVLNLRKKNSFFPRRQALMEPPSEPVTRKPSPPYPIPEKKFPARNYETR